MKKIILQERKILNFSIRSDVFEPFWTQLYRNMGYSRHYQRYVILEPLCFLLQDNKAIKCIPVEPIVYPQIVDLGHYVASIIDREWGDDIEQVLVFSKKYSTILLTDEEVFFQKLRLPELLNYLKNQPEMLKHVLGLVHYHINEPELSVFDKEAIDHFTAELKSMDGSNQLGFVLSESEPNDTLESYEKGQKNFEACEREKLKRGRISLVGNLFSGNNTEIASINVKLES